MRTSWQTLARWWVCLAACLASQGCALPQPLQGMALPQPLQGMALQQALEGLWCNSDDGGRSCWALDEFTPDGRILLCGRTDDDPRPFSATGEVTVEGPQMCYRVTLASPNFWLRPGQRYCTQILAIDARSHRYRDIDTLAEFTLFRRPLAQRQCPAAGEAP